MFTYATSSGVKSTTDSIITMPGQVMGIDVLPPSTGQVTLKIYDSENSTTTGKLILAEAHIDAGMPTLNHEYFRPIIAQRGIYCELTYLGEGSGAGYIVRFALGI